MNQFHLDADRVSYLFTIARDDSNTIPVELTPEEVQELISIRVLLDTIDSAWQAPQIEQDRIRALFLQKLSEQHPEHPWAVVNIVQTIGELIQASDDKPLIPQSSYEELICDTTPVEQLLDMNKRSQIIGELIHRATIPKSDIKELVLWFNRLITNLKPSSDANITGLVFTRQQRRRNGNSK